MGQVEPKEALAVCVIYLRLFKCKILDFHPYFGRTLMCGTDFSVQKFITTFVFSFLHLADMEVFGDYAILEYEAFPSAEEAIRNENGMNFMGHKSGKNLKCAFICVDYDAHVPGYFQFFIQHSFPRPFNSLL